jgi:hypothetical protein
VGSPIDSNAIVQPSREGSGQIFSLNLRVRDGGAPRIRHIPGPAIHFAADVAIPPFGNALDSSSLPVEAVADTKSPLRTIFSQLRRTSYLQNGLPD